MQTFRCSPEVPECPRRKTALTSCGGVCGVTPFGRAVNGSASTNRSTVAHLAPTWRHPSNLTRFDTRSSAAIAAASCSYARCCLDGTSGTSASASGHNGCCCRPSTLPTPHQAPPDYPGGCSAASSHCFALRHGALHHRRYARSVVVHATASANSAGSKARVVYPCKKCGAKHARFYGRCPRCGTLNSVDGTGVLEEPQVAAAGKGMGGGGAGVQALERVQQDAAAAAAAAAYSSSGSSSSSSTRRSSSSSKTGAGGPAYGTGGNEYGTAAGAAADSAGDGGGGRPFGWVANGRSDLEDVPLSLRALTRMGGRLKQQRIPLSGRTGAEVQRVLGGGVVPGALVLIGGDPGVGKSTLTLQIAAMVAHPELDYDALEEQWQGEEKGEEMEEQWRGEEEQERGVVDVDGRGQEGEDEVEVYGKEYDEPAVGANSYDVVEALSNGDGSGYVYGGDADSGALPDAYREPRDILSSDDGGGGGDVDASGSVHGGDVTTEYDNVGPERGPVVQGPMRTVLYITAEETRDQVASRSVRMGLDFCERVIVMCGCEMSAISRAVLDVRPDAVVLDSINTVYLKSLPQAPGSVTQIRECGQMLLRLAKDHAVTVFIIGHVTKGGEMAGPNTLAHMVDTVLYLEGDVAQSVRLLRVVKNRHGSDAECGVFTMDGTGLHAVANHSALFLESRMADSEDEGSSGASSVVGMTLQGTRAILVEVQALVSPLGDRAAAAASALSYRSATGVDKVKLATLCAILDKHVPTLELSGCSVIVNVVGGTQVKDVATDLALAVAVASSYYNAPVPRDLAVCGEVDLAGRIRRSFQRLDVRVREAAKLGFRRVVIPQTKNWERVACDPQLRAAGVEVLAVRNVGDALRAALGPGRMDQRPPHMKPPRGKGPPPPGTGPPGSRFGRQGGGGGKGGGWAVPKGQRQALPAASSVALDGSWPRAAAMGGVAAAYAAAAAAEPLPLPQAAPPGIWMQGPGTYGEAGYEVDGGGGGWYGQAAPNGAYGPPGYRAAGGGGGGGEMLYGGEAAAGGSGGFVVEGDGPGGQNGWTMQDGEADEEQQPHLYDMADVDEYEHEENGYDTYGGEGEQMAMEEP